MSEPHPIIPRGSFGGQPQVQQASDPRQPVEERNNLLSRSFARIMDMTSEGPIQGLCNRAGTVITQNKWLGMGVFLNGTAMISSTGIAAFSGVSVAQNFGTQSQAQIDGFSTAEETINVALPLKFGLPLDVEIADATTTSVIVALKVHSLFKQDKKTGDINGTGIRVRVQIILRGGAVALDQFINILGKTQTDFIKQVEYVLPRSSTPDTDFWTIRVVRVTNDSTTVLLQNESEFSYVTRVVGAQLRYPNSAIIAMQFDAQSFTSIPTRAFNLKGRLVKVPSNYYPPTRSYKRRASDGHLMPDEQPWDGTFWTTWTDNPAWCFYDLCTNTRYGLGDFLTRSAQVDKWTLYTIARYCDQAVPNPVLSGRMEPRYTCNVYLQDRQEAIKVLTDMASMFRGFVYWASGTIVTVHDAPKDPLMQFSNANVRDGRFIYSSTAKRARHTVALVRWNDPADFYNPKFEYISDDDGIANFGIREVEITAFGCTRRGQAIRMGKWALATELQETEMVRLVTGLEGLYPKPGDIVKVLDQHRAAVRHGGRLMAIAPDRLSVTLDANVTLEVGAAYTLTVILPQGFTPPGVDLPDSSYIGSIRTTQLLDRPVTTGSGSHQVLAFAVALPAEVLVGSVWSLETPNLVAQLFRVIQVTEQGDNQFEIQGVEHNPSKFAAVDQAMTLTDEQITKLPNYANVPNPLNFTAVPGYNDTPEQVGLYILLSWTAPAGTLIRSYILDAQRDDNGNWEQAAEVSSTSYKFPYSDKGKYNFRLYAINAVGVRSTGVTATVTIEQAVSPVPPPDVTGLELVGADGAGQGLDTTFVGRDAAFQWRVNSSLRSYDFGDEPMGAAGAIDDPYFQDFEVSIFEPGSTARMWYETVKTPHFVFTYEKNQQAFGQARNRFTIRVNARDKYNAQGVAALMTAANPAPAQHLALTVLVSFKSAFLSWVNPPDPDLDHTEVWMSSTPVYADAGLVGLQAAPGTTLSVLNLASNTDYYFWLVAVDTFGSHSNIFPDGAVHVVPGTIPQSDLDTLAIDITQIFQNTISLKGAVWKDNDPAPGFISWNAHQLIFRGQTFAIAAGNTNLPYVWWRGPIYATDGVTLVTPGEAVYRSSASHPKDGGPPEAGGENDFIVATNAESGGLHDLAWRTLANALIGSAYIRTAAIQDAHIQNVTADKILAGQINSQEIIVSGGASGIIRSLGYVTGVSGWAVLGDGNAEFNGVVVRGTLAAGKIFNQTIIVNPAYPNNAVQPMAIINQNVNGGTRDFAFTGAGATATNFNRGGHWNGASITAGVAQSTSMVMARDLTGVSTFYGTAIVPADLPLIAPALILRQRLGGNLDQAFAVFGTGKVAWDMVPVYRVYPVTSWALAREGTLTYPWIIDPLLPSVSTASFIGAIVLAIPFDHVLEFQLIPMTSAGAMSAANDVITDLSLTVLTTNPQS